MGTSTEQYIRDNGQDVAIAQLAGCCAELADLVAFVSPDNAERARELRDAIQHVADVTLRSKRERDGANRRGPLVGTACPNCP